MVVAEKKMGKVLIFASAFSREREWLDCSQDCHLRVEAKFHP